MSTAAEWAAISRFRPGSHENVRPIGTTSVTNLTWSQQQAAMSAAPLFGDRRQWDGYSAETTGYGSLELSGPLPHRVTIVHPSDADALRRHHRLVRRGRLRPAWYESRLDSSRLHVLARAELCRSRADDRGSWLFAAQRIASLCAADDDVARLVGPALRQLLWAGREQLGSDQVSAACTELRRAAEALAAERQAYLESVERLTTGSVNDVTDRRFVADVVQDDLETIRLEVRVLAEVQREWDATA